MNPGSSLSFNSTIRAYPAVAGGGWDGGEPYSGTVTFKHTASHTAGALPAGTTITVDHDSIVIAPGDTTDHFILWTITLPTDVGFTIEGCLIHLEATDGRTTSSLSIHINGA